MQVRVSNAGGTAAATVRICVGPLLALTPPMGWNSWNVYGDRVSAEVIVRIAEEMVANGMRDLGYQYVNIDDFFWHAAGHGPRTCTPVANPTPSPTASRRWPMRCTGSGSSSGSTPMRRT